MQEKIFVVTEGVEGGLEGQDGRERALGESAAVHKGEMWPGLGCWQ